MIVIVSLFKTVADCRLFRSVFFSLVFIVHINIHIKISTMNINTTINYYSKV